MPSLPLLPDIDCLSDKELRALVVALLGKVASLEERVAAQAEEIARLKGLKGKPQIKPSKPSGMDKAATKQADREWRKKQRRGAKKPSVPVEEKTVAAPDAPRQILLEKSDRAISVATCGTSGTPSPDGLESDASAHIGLTSNVCSH